MSSIHLRGVFRSAIALLVFSLLTLGTSAKAQTAGTGALEGTVTDATNAVIANVTVRATSADTGQVRTTKTGPDGTYKFNLLSPGNYSVKFEAAGFSAVEVPSATINVTETNVLNRALTLGTQTQQITVEGEVETVQTENSALGTVVNTATVSELPLNTRNFTNLLAMSSGVAANVSNATTIGKGATNMAVNGASTAQNTYLMDGITVNNWTALGGVTEGTVPGTFAMPNPDAIAEFKIQTSSYDAGYGRNPGANVNVITKSGTNSFHGTAFEFFRNSILNANDWFIKEQGLAKPVLNSNQFGGAFGGPVKKDKLFFFVNYQETQQKNGFASYSQSATILPPIPNGNRGTCGPVGFSTIAACDTAGAAFVRNLAQNMCSSSVRKGTTARVQCPSAGPGDPAGLFNINPVAISILQLKLPNGTNYVPGSGTSGFVAQNFLEPAGFKDHQGIGNVDYVINSNNTFSGRYIYEKDPLNANFPALNALEPGNSVEGNTIQTVKTNQSTTAKLTSIVSANIVNEAHMAYQLIATNNSEAVLFHNSQVGIQDFSTPNAPGPDNLSYININGSGNSGLLDFGVHPTFGGHSAVNQYVTGDEVSISHGKHTFRTGFEAEWVRVSTVSGSGSVGQPTFTSFADFLIGRAGCGAGLLVTPNPGNPGGCNGGTASNLTNQGGTTAANPTKSVNPRVHLFNSFFQDDFKLNARFTLNLGLRWELDNWPTDGNGSFSSVWPSLMSTAPPPIVTVPGGAGETLTGYVVPSNYNGPLPPAGLGLYQNSIPYYTRRSAPKDNFAPRVGFAWQPTTSNRLVVRGGFGYFYDLISAQYSATFGRANPVFGPPAFGSAAASLQNPWAIPPGLVTLGPGYFGFVPRWVDSSTVSTDPTKLCLQPPCSSNITPTAYGQDLTVPLTYQWNLNTQWEFMPSWVLEIGYVGSHGIHQLSPGAVNGPTADGSPINTYFNVAQLAGVGAPCVSCGVTGVASNSSGNAVLRVPNLGISANASEIQTISNYKFNSLQTTLRKQMSHGLQLQAAFSWSRGFETVPAGSNTYPYVVQAYAPEYFVRPLRLVVNYVWDLPLGHHDGLLGKATEGWSLSGVTVIQNGQPIDIVDSGDGGIFGISGGVAGTIGEPQLCPGFSRSQILTSGSASQRVKNGLNGLDGWINSAAFISCGDAVPSNVGASNGVGGGVGFGNMPFGNVLGPGQSNWDMSLAKMTTVGGIRENATLQFRAEFYNTFNHPQFSNLVGSDVQNGVGMGAITTSSVSPRVIQFGLKYQF